MNERESVFSKAKLEQLRRRVAEWSKRNEKALERPDLFTTISGIPVHRVYTAADVGEMEHDELPGEYPYTRGIHATGYRGKMWTMRMFSGFGTAEETNERYRYLLKEGNDGLSVAFDMPTLMGYDTDHPLSVGEFGKCGVAVSSLADMELLFKDIPLGDVSTSLTINGPAAPIWAMYIVAAEKQGVPWSKLRGTVQNDILKEFIAQNEFIFPPESSMRLSIDLIEYAAKDVPQWNGVSISGYHIREAGSTAAQELAFTLADGFAYVDSCLARGMVIDEFAPRLSFFFNAHNDFFEEIAKYRAARRIWATVLREKYGAKNPKSLQLRFHTQTAGCSLTVEQPENNIVRTALQALAGVLGGTQSLHTNSMDEALALPSEKAVTIALRTQQIIAHETGVANTVDPLGGAYFVEAMTDRLEAEARDYFRQIERLGGVIACIEKGFFHKEIADASYRYQREVEKGQRLIVGVNAYTSPAPAIQLLEMDKAGERRHLERLNRVRRERDNVAVKRALAALAEAANGTQNTMPYIVEAVRAYATLGEITDTLRQTWGEHMPFGAASAAVGA